MEILKRWFIVGYGIQTDAEPPHNIAYYMIPTYKEEDIKPNLEVAKERVLKEFEKKKIELEEG